ncbi:MAG: hypothetical protein JHC70_10815 [Rhodococcus sp.]|nr:hypothetical protein [Rhodococcus sp. (in: high G+C Gram-positive bacteria)]MBJ7322816.1 hypothetical protein [Rhodococcus sp. (in: high G+C Gram-positive bacteria)]
MTDHSRSAALSHPTAGRSTLVGVDSTTLDAAGSTAVGQLFRSRSAATAFALTHAAQSWGTLVSLDFTVFECDTASLDSASEGMFRAWDEVSVTGSVTETACALAILDEYRVGVRRAKLPLPAALTAEIYTLSNAVASPVHPSRVDDPETVEVRLCSIRPEPLPHNRTSIGFYGSEDAERVAGVLAYRFGGDIAPTNERGCIQVHHSADISDSERAAVDRYTRIAELRANIAALDPRRDIAVITRLDGELDTLCSAVLRRRSTPSPTPVAGSDVVRRYLPAPVPRLDSTEEPPP